MELGYGGIGSYVNISGNDFHTTGGASNQMLAAIMVDQYLISSSTNPGNFIGPNTVENTSILPAITAAPNGPVQITGITQANPAVITFASGPTVSANQVYLIKDVYGMTQINGLLCTVSASTSTTMTCGNGTAINSTSFTAFATPLQGAATALLLYTSGTTPAYPWPSQVEMLRTRSGGFYGTPTVVAGSGAGTSPTITLAGTDKEGSISVTTGTSTVVSSTILTATFYIPYPAAPYCQIQPTNSNASQLSGTSQVIPSSSATTFTLSGGGTALASSTAYTWTYHCGRD